MKKNLVLLLLLVPAISSAQVTIEPSPATVKPVTMCGRFTFPVDSPLYDNTHNSVQAVATLYDSTHNLLPSMSIVVRRSASHSIGVLAGERDLFSSGTHGAFGATDL